MEDFKIMTKTHIIVLTSLALVMALCMSVPQAQATENVLRLHSIPAPAPAMTMAVPDAATPLIQQGMTAMGPTPPVTGVVGGVQTGPPSWPCFPQSAPCTGDPVGGYLGAKPEELFSIATCGVPFNQNNGRGGCGQLWWMFETAANLRCPAAGCPLAVAITAKQGTNTVYSLPLTNIGSIPSPAQFGGPYVEVIYGQQGFGPTWSTGAVNPTAGNVVITVVTQVTAGTTTTTKVKAQGNLTVVVQ